MVVESAVVSILVLVERKLTFVITDILNEALAERGFNNIILVDCYFGRALSQTLYRWTARDRSALVKDIAHISIGGNGRILTSAKFYF